MSNVKEKIQKLLALSESPNENEAQAAMCKARELMAKYKLDERDFKKKKEKLIIKRVEISNVLCNTRRDPWILDLQNLIARNYCCMPICKKENITYYIGFVGLDEDVDICADVFKYALNCIYNGIAKKKNENKKLKAKEFKTISWGYAYGFIDGLKLAFVRQTQENDWGLIMHLPKEVNDFIGRNSTFRVQKFKQAEIDINAFEEGKEEGKQFTTRKKIGNENEKIGGK